MTDYKKLIEKVWDLVDDSPDWPRLGTTLDSLEAILDEVRGLAEEWETMARDYSTFAGGRALAEAAAAELRAALEGELK